MSFFKSAFYYGMKGLLRLFTPFYFRRIRIFGLESLPKEGGILLSPNHQGAFLDPLLVGAYIPKKLFSLTRGDVFVPPFRWLFNAMQMLPVFRIRNGYSSLKNNEATFDRCHSILAQGEKLMMFSEGLHHSEMYLYPISKGSSRLAYQAQNKFPNKPIHLIPVGINYQNYNRPWKGLHLVIGKAIPIQNYLNTADKEVHTINRIRHALAEGMKACLWIPENSNDYKQKVTALQQMDCSESFETIRNQLATTESPSHKTSKVPLGIQLLLAILRVPNAIPLWMTTRLMQSFSDPIFHGSVKYASGLFIFPLWYLIICGVFSFFYSFNMLIIILLCFIINLYLYILIKNKFIL